MAWTRRCVAWTEQVSACMDKAGRQAGEGFVELCTSLVCRDSGRLHTPTQRSMMLTVGAAEPSG